MMKSFIFDRLTPEKKAQQELEEARMELLKAQSCAEYWDAQAVYHQARIERLKDFLGRDKVTAGVSA